MKLRTKSIIFAIGVIASLVILVFLISQLVILQGFVELESERTLTDVSRAVNAVNAEVEKLHTFSADWAYWDDTYQFMEDKNEDYIDSNLVDSTFINTGLNLIVYLDTDFKVTYQKAFDLKAKKESVVPADLTSYFRGDSPLFSQGEKGVSGILVLNEGPLLVSSRHILTSNEEGPSRGYLLMASFLDEMGVARLSKITELPFSIEVVEGVPAKIEETRLVNGDEIEGRGALADLSGEKSLIVKFISARSITRQGQKTVVTLMVILVSAGAVITLIGLLFLEKTILSRLFVLLNEVNAIGVSGDYSGRVTARGKDEIGMLSSRVNSMLEVLERSGETKLAASINSLPLGFFIVDLDHIIQSINPAMMNILGTRVRPQRLEELRSYFGKSFDIKYFCGDCRAEKKLLRIPELNYKNRILAIISVPIVDQLAEKLRGTAVIFEDITEAKNLERAKDEFFALAAHELRTPLSVIRGNTSLLHDYFAEQVKDQSLVGMFKDIHDSSVRLIDVVNDFLDVSRLEQSKEKIGIKEINVSLVIKESIKGLESKAKEKGIYLKFAGVGKAPAFANADIVRHILDNLIANAINFTKEGGVTVTTSLGSEFLKVSVTDTGAGISSENQTHLFKKFQQAGGDVRRRDVSRGTGLGLYLSKLMVEKLGGKISLDKSEVGRGSTFSFTLPLSAANQAGLARERS